MNRRSDKQSQHGKILPALLLCLMAALALVAAVLLIPGNGDQGDLLDPGFTSDTTLTWSEGEQRSYALQVTSRVDVGLADSGNALVEQRIAGTLQLKVLQTLPGAVELGLQVPDLELRVNGAGNPVQEAALRSAFGARYDHHGQPLEFAFPRNLDPAAADQLEELLRSFQVVLPAEATAEWDNEEHHGSGRYLARYRWTGGRSIEKTKLHYLQGAAVEVEDASDLREGTTRLEHSTATIHIDPGQSWIDSMELDEALEVSTGDEATLYAVTTASLRAIPGAPASTLSAASDLDSLLEQQVAAVRAAAIAARTAQETPASDADIARFLADLGAFAEGEGKDIGLLHQLVAQMKRHPELALRVPEQLDEATLADRAASGLIHSLELADHEPAQRALLTVYGDGERSDMNRVRALVALGGITDPDPKTLDALWQVSADRAGPDASDRANTALLSLGRLGAAMRSNGHPDYRDLQQGLQTALASSPDEQTTVMAIKAIGNDPDPVHEASIAPYLHSSSAAVRAASAESLGILDQASAVPALTGQLRLEGDGRVRAVITESLGSMSHESEETFHTVRSLVADEKDKDARFQMVRYLVDRVERHPDVRETLRALLPTVKDERTLQVLGRGL